MGGKARDAKPATSQPAGVCFTGRDAKREAGFACAQERLLGMLSGRRYFVRNDWELQNAASDFQRWALLMVCGVGTACWGMCAMFTQVYSESFCTTGGQCFTTIDEQITGCFSYCEA